MRVRCPLEEAEAALCVKLGVFHSISDGLQKQRPAAFFTKNPTQLSVRKPEPGIAATKASRPPLPRKALWAVDVDDA
jgi:hypothetical protein